LLPCFSTLLRPTTLAELYGPDRLGRLSGVAALFSTLGRAAGPLAVSLSYVAFGGYEPALGGLILLLVMAAALVLVAPARRAIRELDDARRREEPLATTPAGLP
jgi:hypothetical protein